jgi:integrase
MKCLDESSTTQLLKAVEGSALHLPVLLAATTGMRRGEILGLRWQDVDLDAATLGVRQSLEETKTGLVFKPPKTQKGRRSVALPLMTVEVLRRHRVEQAEARLASGRVYQDHGLVIARANGEPIRPSTVTKAFEDLARNAGLQGTRFHDLRHTHATTLLRHGVHPKVVSERLGHSTVGITLDVYSHVLPGMQEEAARRVDAVLRTAMEAKSSSPSSSSSIVAGC